MSLKQEISQQRPFTNIAEEALLNLMRTADLAHREMQRHTKTWGITATQYNVLRILRGAQPQGLTCSAIGARMITADPDITRLLKRLKGQKLVKQQRDRQDRRVVWNQIATPGLRLLEQFQPIIEHYPQEFFASLSEDEQKLLISLLERIRNNSQVSCDGSHTPTCDGVPPVTCDGNHPEQQENGCG